MHISQMIPEKKNKLKWITNTLSGGFFTLNFLVF